MISVLAAEACNQTSWSEVVVFLICAIVVCFFAWMFFG